MPSRLVSSRAAVLTGALRLAVLFALFAVSAALPRAASAQTSPWTAIDIDEYGSGGTAILWRRTDNQYAVWKVNSSGVIEFAKAYGPVTGGYTCDSLAIAGSDSPVLLFKSPSARKVVTWFLKSDLTQITKARTFDYPAAQYLDAEFDATSSNTARLLWKLTNNRFLIWTVSVTTDQTPQVSQVYGPYGTGANQLTVGKVASSPSGDVLVTFQNPTTKAYTLKLWGISLAPEPGNSVVVGPYSGTVLRDVVFPSDRRPRLLWGYTNGKAAIWKLGFSPSNPNVPVIVDSGVYGPYAGVASVAITTDSGERTRLLWRYETGRAALWNIPDTLDSILSAYTYGPLR